MRYTWDLTSELTVQLVGENSLLVAKVDTLVCFSVDNPAGLSYRFFGEPGFHFIPMYRIRSVSWSDIGMTSGTVPMEPHK